MNHEELLTQTVLAIHNNADLNSTMSSWYNREPLIFQGMDLSHRPEPEQCPAVEIDLVGGQKGGIEEDENGIPINTAYFSLILTIHDNTLVQSALPRVTEKAGVARREAFRRMVTRIVVDTANSQGLNIGGIEHTNQEIDQYPFWQVVLAVGVTEQLTLGADPYNE